MGNLEDTLRDAVARNKSIRIQAYAVSDEVERRVQTTLRLILSRHNRMELLPPVYTCLKELLINAVKANYKNIYFESYSSKNDAESVIAYNLALKLFKLEMSRENAAHLERLARDAGLKAEILFETAGDSLHIVVTNPVTMTDIEMDNVSRKLDAARRYDDIAQYFVDNDTADDSADEGAGLGIILVSIMLRNMGVAREDFSICTQGNSTVASIRIPLEQGIEALALR